MELEHQPLLQVQRDLYEMPRGMERFREYLRTMTDPRTGDIRLPLSSMNPMGKEHLAPFLDRLLELDAEGAAAEAVAEARSALAGAPGSFRVGLVVSDDLRGGWTNRHTTELDHCFRGKAMHRRGWIPVLLWTSESYERARVRRETLACIQRVAWIQRHGYARTLGEMLAQEGYALRASGAAASDDAAASDPEELEYTRAVLQPLLASTDVPTLIPALYGDEAARTLGYRPLGLSARAAFAVALQDACARA